MAPNDSFRNGALQYNLLEEIIEREEFNFQPDFIAVDWVPVRPTVRITENVFMVLNILPPDFERCLLIRAEESLASNELLPYVDPQPSNLSLEEARLLIANFISQGLIFSTEAIDNRQFIEERFTELLICYGEGRLQPAHDGILCDCGPCSFIKVVTLMIICIGILVWLLVKQHELLSNRV